MLGRLGLVIFAIVFQFAVMYSLIWIIAYPELSYLSVEHNIRLFGWLAKLLLIFATISAPKVVARA